MITTTAVHMSKKAKLLIRKLAIFVVKYFLHFFVCMCLGKR